VGIYEWERNDSSSIISASSRKETKTQLTLSNGVRACGCVWYHNFALMVDKDVLLL
jgi:hypothetical protein